jgi:hypothetical protein
MADDFETFFTQATRCTRSHTNVVSRILPATSPNCSRCRQVLGKPPWLCSHGSGDERSGPPRRLGRSWMRHDCD